MSAKGVWIVNGEKPATFFIDGKQVVKPLRQTIDKVLTDAKAQEIGRAALGCGWSNIEIYFHEYDETPEPSFGSFSEWLEYQP